MRIHDHRELVNRGLVEREERNGRTWWRVRYNTVEGPPPEYRTFLRREDELAALATRIENLIEGEGVQAGDIRVVAHLERNREEIRALLAQRLARLNVAVDIQRRQAYSRDNTTLVITTAHSFKGYEGEIVFVPAAESFTAIVDGKRAPLAETLYVALTRARSFLYVSSTRASDREGQLIQQALEGSNTDLRSPPEIVCAPSDLEQRLDLVDVLGDEHRAWLDDLWRRYPIERDPILDDEGAIAAEPLFSLQVGNTRHACFAADVPVAVRHRLDDLGVRLLRAGQQPQQSSTEELATKCGDGDERCAWATDGSRCMQPRAVGFIFCVDHAAGSKH